MFGGSQGEPPLVVPQIVKTRTAPNSPFLSNSSKEVYQQSQSQKKKVDTQKPSKSNLLPGCTAPSDMQQTLKLEVFNPKNEPPAVPVVPYQPIVATNIFPGLNPTLQHLFAPTTAFSYGPNVHMPMQKVYNINLPGPLGGHVEMRNIYENVLPAKDMRFTFTTLGERLKLYDYVRQILIKMYDGEDIGLDSDGHRSLMSYLKFMELNPNYYSTINKNPYDGLPYGLLIYRSCFPIRLDKISKSIQCAKNSIGLNIRLYSLSYAEYYSYKFRQTSYKKYDVWRELIFYEYLREKIIKKKESPNFPILYAFFMSSNKKINFFALKKSCLTQKDLMTLEYKKFKEFYQMRDAFIKTKMANGKVINVNALGEVIASAKNPEDYLPDEVDPILQKYSGTTLIVITEAPIHNLYQWASYKYEQDGIASKMIERGYHDENVWISILFQISSAICVLQKHGIYMGNMTIEDNIYIRDLYSDGNIMGYWIYVIDGISYYIPNYGYLVMVDSNFKDIIPNIRVQERVDPNGKFGREYKMYSSKELFDKPVKESEIFELNYQNFRNIINPNIFTKEHTKNNVLKPPEQIMQFINEISLDTEHDIGKIIRNHFGRLMNNRIGTFLKKDIETANIRATTTKFSRGEMVIQTIDNDTYKWSIIVSDIPSDTDNVEIIDRDNPVTQDFILKKIPKSNLKQYSQSEKIEQNLIGSEALFNETNLLETYIIS
jgi:hypothetical protein